MTNGGETADQMTRMTLQGIEVAANVALKAGGMASKSLAATLYAILTDRKKVKGKARLNSMLKSGKELKVFAIRHKDLKTFCQEAKRYGVLYSVLKEKNNTDGICDIMVRAEDAAKISRIVDKYELATIDTNAIRNSILNERQNPLKDVPILNDKEHDDLVHKLMASTKNKKQKNSKENSDINPKKAWTEKTKDSPFEHISTQENTERPSVRAKLNEYKMSHKKPAQSKQRNKSRSKNKKTKER